MLGLAEDRHELGHPGARGEHEAARRIGAALGRHLDAAIGGRLPGQERLSKAQLRPMLHGEAGMGEDCALRGDEAAVGLPEAAVFRRQVKRRVATLDLGAVEDLVLQVMAQARLA